MIVVSPSPAQAICSRPTTGGRENLALERLPLYRIIMACCSFLSRFIPYLPADYRETNQELNRAGLPHRFDLQAERRLIFSLQVRQQYTSRVSSASFGVQLSGSSWSSSPQPLWFVRSANGGYLSGVASSSSSGLALRAIRVSNSLLGPGYQCRSRA